AIGTGQHFTTFGLYVAASIFAATLIGVFRGCYELVTGHLLRAAGVRRRALLVGEPAQRKHLHETLGSSRGGIDYDFVGEVNVGAEIESLLASSELDEIVVADSGLDERRPFEMRKFRTMVAGADRAQAALERENEATGALFKIRDDPRVTPVGRVLRRLSLDEVPNVINVLRGEMSLVGPRPLPVRDYERLQS